MFSYQNWPVDVRQFPPQVSFGSVNSLCEMPVTMSHASIPHAETVVEPLPTDLIRLSVGIEDVRDLLADLDQAFKAAEAFRGLEPEVVRAIYRGKVGRR